MLKYVLKTVQNKLKHNLINWISSIMQQKHKWVETDRSSWSQKAAGDQRWFRLPDDDSRKVISLLVLAERWSWKAYKGFRATSALLQTSISGLVVFQQDNAEPHTPATTAWLPHMRCLFSPNVGLHIVDTYLYLGVISPNDTVLKS